MATYLSQPYQGSKYIPTIPLDIVAQGLQLKQRQTDEFRAHTQGMLDELGKNTFYRDSDLSYINNRLRDATDQINNFSGQKLDDGQVQSQINSIISGLTSDPDITRRVIANKQRAKSVNDMLEIKEKHPDLWNMQNYLDWKAQDDQWKNNPDQMDYTATYQPYVDTHKYDEEAQKDILSNPITRTEIDYYTDAKGVRHKRGEREVQEVTSNRLKSAMLSGMPDNVRGQHMIEYRNYLRAVTPEMAASMSKDETSVYEGLLAQVNEVCNNPKATPEQREQANQMALVYEQAIKLGNQNTRDLADGKKPVSDYLSFDKYIDGKYQRIANAHAYNKTGKYNYDDLFMEDVKSQHARSLETLKHNLKMQENQDASAPLNNDFVNGIMNAMLSSSSTINANSMADLLGVTGKQDDRGYYNLPINGTDISLNTTPIVQSYLPQADNRKVLGLQELKSAFATYKMQHPAGQLITAPEQSTVDPSTGNTYTWSGVNSQGSSSVTKEPTFQEFLQYMKNVPGASDKFKTSYGIDLNNPKDIEDSKSAEVVMTKAVGNNQSFRFNKGAGNLRITTTVNGGNLFRGDDGEFHVATTALATKKQIEAGLGYDPSTLYGKPGSPNLIMPAGEKDKDGDELFSFPVILKVSGDMMSKFNENLSNHSGLGSTELKENRGSYNSEFAKKFSAIQAVSKLGYQDIPTSTLRNNIVAKIQQLMPDPKAQAQYINACDVYINALNSNPSAETRAKIYSEFYKIMNAKSGANL